MSRVELLWVDALREAHVQHVVVECIHSASELILRQLAQAQLTATRIHPLSLNRGVVERVHRASELILRQLAQAQLTTTRIHPLSLI